MALRNRRDLVQRPWTSSERRGLSGAAFCKPAPATVTLELTRNESMALHRGKYADRRARSAPEHVRLSFGQSTHDAAQDRQCIHRAVVLALFKVRAALGHRVAYMRQAEDLAASRCRECIQSGRLHFDC